MRICERRPSNIGNLGILRDKPIAVAQLAEVYSWVAEPQTAVAYYKEALEGYRKIGDLPKQIEVLASLGEAGYLTDEISTEDGENYFKDGQQLVASLTGFDPYVRVRAAEGKKLSQEELDKIFREWREKLPTLKSEHRMAAGTLYQKWGRSLLEGNNPQGAQVMLFLAFEYHSILPPLKAALFNREIAIELAKDAYFLGEAFRQSGSHVSGTKLFSTCGTDSEQFADSGNPFCVLRFGTDICRSWRR